MVDLGEQGAALEHVPWRPGRTFPRSGVGDVGSRGRGGGRGRGQEGGAAPRCERRPGRRHRALDGTGRERHSSLVGGACGEGAKECRVGGSGGGAVREGAETA